MDALVYVVQFLGIAALAVVGVYILARVASLGVLRSWHQMKRRASAPKPLPKEGSNGI
jgi:hypothetical protein